MSTTVTHNDSAHEGSDVVCNTCERGESSARNRKDGIGGVHCRTCHSDKHRACAACDVCLPDDHRWDRFYCSSTCRGRGKRDREAAALEHAIWEAEHPAEAAAKRTEFEAWEKELHTLAAIHNPPAQRERRARVAALKARAEECATCEMSFASGDVIYRRAQFGYDGPVLPYCAEHCCPTWEGYHNRDAPEGRHYPACSCPGGYGDRKWTEPKPCVGCGRLVCNDRKTADPWRFTRSWSWAGEREHKVRALCSEDCRRSVTRAEAKAKRDEARGDQVQRCESCGEQFDARAGACYCSSRCRQSAYRERRRLAA